MLLVRAPQVSLNTVDSLEAFTADVHAGRWDIVLPQARTLRSQLWMHAHLPAERSRCTRARA
jgi:hypothetical protein